jgi:branched-chain amino acid transport system permease protein
MASLIIQLLIIGTLQGGTYALAAFGLSLIFGVSNVLNLAHGQFLMLGGLLTFVLFTATKWNPLLLSLILIPLFFGIGYLFEKGLIRPLLGRKGHELVIASILVTLGASLAIEDITSFLWGPEEKGISYIIPSLTIGSMVISSVRLLGLLFITVLTVAVHLFLKKTYTGRALRATTQNRQGAMLMGVNTFRIGSITFGIGTILASAAGVFYVILFTITPFIGIPLSIKYLCIIVMGGLGSLYGSLIGGLILGITEAVTGFFAPHWSETAAFFILVAVLLIRPRGLFG